MARLAQIPKDDPEAPKLRAQIDELQHKLNDLQNTLQVVEQKLDSERTALALKSSEFDTIHDELLKVKLNHEAALSRIAAFEKGNSEFEKKVKENAESDKVEFQKKANAFRLKEAQKYQSQISSLETQKENLEALLNQQEIENSTQASDKEKVCHVARNRERFGLIANFRSTSLRNSFEN